MTLNEFNGLSSEDSKSALMKCCTSVRWGEGVTSNRPFESVEQLFTASDEIWFSLDRNDFLEAFEGHPKIGDVNSLKEKYRNTKELASGEQSGMDEANDEIINELAKLNDLYEQRFGYIFIVCATGKSALEMLNILKGRINNSAEDELRNAAVEQSKITRIRLEKIL